MKRAVTILLSLTLPVLACTARAAGPIKLKAKTAEDGIYTVDMTKNVPGLYSLIVRYKGADGRERIYWDTVSVSRRFLALRPEQAAMLGRGRYKMETALGNAWGMIDTSVVYRLPFSVHRGPTQYRLTIENGTPAHTFALSRGDTVFAARKGVVIFSGRNEKGATEVRVQHPDSSWSSYLGLDSGRGLAACGTTVWPDTPIGFVGKKGKHGYGVTLQIKYATVAIGKKGLSVLYEAAMDPLFATASMEPAAKRTYMVVPRISYEIITQEMTAEDAKAMGPEL